MEYLAAFYDKFILPQKPQVVTDAEIAYIQTLAEPGSRILDVGCGTGRHLIPLSRLGYEVVGVEKNLEMVEQLKANLPEAKLFIVDILNRDISNKIISQHQNYFDLIILMWNAVNEMAYSEEELVALISIFTELLTPDGKILIQVDQDVRRNPLTLNFTTLFTESDGIKYTYSSHICRWDDENSTSICNEKLIVETENSREEIKGEVKQRWWSKEELTRFHKNIIVI